MSELYSALLDTKVLSFSFGRFRTSLTSLNAASRPIEGNSEATEGMGTQEDTSSLTSQPTAPTGDSKKKSAPTKKRGTRSRLIGNYVLWAYVRAAVPGQERREGQNIEYRMDCIVFTIKLFTKTISIDSVKQKDSSTSRRSYPIVAAFRDRDLKSFFNSLSGFNEWGELFTNSQSRTGTIMSRVAPITIPIITLPYRLPGFTPSVIKRMLNDIDLLIEVKSDLVSVVYNTLTSRITLAAVTVQHTEDGKETFVVNGSTLSGSLTRELRSILNSLASPERLTDKVLNLIKTYLYVLKSALTLLDRAAAKPSDEG